MVNVLAGVAVAALLGLGAYLYWRDAWNPTPIPGDPRLVSVEPKDGTVHPKGGVQLTGEADIDLATASVGGEPAYVAGRSFRATVPVTDAGFRGAIELVGKNGGTSSIPYSLKLREVLPAKIEPEVTVKEPATTKKPKDKPDDKTRSDDELPVEDYSNWTVTALAPTKIGRTGRLTGRSSVPLESVSIRGVVGTIDEKDEHVFHVDVTFSATDSARQSLEIKMKREDGVTVTRNKSIEVDAIPPELRSSTPESGGHRRLEVSAERRRERRAQERRRRQEGGQTHRRQDVRNGDRDPEGEEHARNRTHRQVRQHEETRRQRSRRHIFPRHPHSHPRAERRSRTRTPG